MIKLSNKEEVKKQITNQNNLIEKYINKQIHLSNELISSINIFTEDIFNEFVKYIAQIKKNLEFKFQIRRIKNGKRQRYQKTTYNRLY